MLTPTQTKDAHMLEEIYMSFKKHMHHFSEHVKIIQCPLRAISQRHTEILHTQVSTKIVSFLMCSCKIRIKYSQRQETMAVPYFYGAEYKVSFLRTYPQSWQSG